MKKFAVIAIACILILSILLCGCTKSTSDYTINNSDSINIGIIASDDSVLKGVDYASSLAPLVHIDKEYKINTLTYSINDDINTTASELLSQNVCAVICDGSYKTHTDLIIKAFEDTSIPLVFIGNHSDLIQTTDNAFSISTPYNYQSSAAVSYLTSEGLSTGAIVLGDDSEYMTTVAEMFESAFMASGGKSVSTYYFTGEKENFSAKAISGAGLDFAFIIADDASRNSIYTELVDAGFASQIVFSEVIDKAQLHDESYNNVSFISNFELDDNNYIGSDFINTYSEKNGIKTTEVTPSIAYGYDAYMTIYEVLRNFNPNSQSLSPFSTEATAETGDENNQITVSQVKDALKEIEYFGVTDTITFDQNGLSNTTFIYIDKVENAQPKMLNRYEFNNEQN
ncbi:MAG: ABC transporter substrate-binding protein [Clostridia bacterium]|nr:ABC transporter substrate-binding protein [Clostridia bacterium]